jgi:predicted O-methyltransferase YrrM
MLSHSVPTVSTLVGVDLRVHNQRLLSRLARPGLAIHLIGGDSREAPVVEAVRRVIPAHGLDVLFIDGDHSYAGVRSDYLNYRNLVRDGGVIAFHDIVPDHAARFGRRTDSWTGDVPLFWSRLKPVLDTCEFVTSRDQDGFGIGVVIHSAATPLPVDL